MATLTQLPDDVDLSFVAGDTFRIRVRVLDPADGSAETLDNYTFCAWVIRAEDRTFAADFDITDDPTSGTPPTAIILTLPPGETAVLPGMGDGQVFHGLWDLQVTFPNSDIRTVAKGSVTCYVDISCPEPPTP